MAFGDDMSRDPSNTGEGEDMMQLFIQQHMMSILAPIADHVRALQEQVGQLVRDAPVISSTMDRHENKLEHNEQKLSHVWNSLSNNNARLEKMQQDLLKVNDERATLEAQHEVTRASLARADSVLQATAASLIDLRNAAKGMDVNVRQLQSGFAETNKVLSERLEPGLSQLRELQDALNERFLDINQEVKQDKQFSRSTKETLSELMKAVESQKLSDNRRFTKLGEQVAVIETSLAEGNHRQHTMGEHLKATNVDLRQLRTGLEQTNGALQCLESQHAETVRALGDTMSRMTKAEEDITQGSINLTAEKKHLMDFLQDLDRKFHKVAADLTQLDQTQRTQHDLLQGTVQRADGLESHARASDERAEGHEVDLRNFAAWQREATTEIECLTLEHNKTAVHVQTTSKSLDATCDRLNRVSDSLDCTNETAAKLGQRLDLAHSYFQGLSKGFRDTHKRVVAGEDGMLPPRQTSPTLPMITSPSPRQTLRR